MIKLSKNVKIFLSILVIIGFLATLIIVKPAKIDRECCNIYCEAISPLGKCLAQSNNQVVCGLDYSEYGYKGTYEQVVFQFDDPIKVCRGVKHEKSMGQNQTEQIQNE
jgi:hypothetical protein